MRPSRQYRVLAISMPQSLKVKKEQLEGFPALNQSHHMKYVGRIGRYNILWNGFLWQEKRKFARSHR
jgi:hypothetical protein